MAASLNQWVNMLAQIGRPRIPGDQYLSVAEVLGDSSYPTGGYAVNAATFGLNAVDAVIPICTNTGYVPIWDQVNQKVKLFWTGAAVSSALAEITAATNVSTVKIYLLIIGR